MKEYKYIDSYNGSDLVDMMNALSGEGWKMITILARSGSSRLEVFMEREKPEEE